MTYWLSEYFLPVVVVDLKKQSLSTNKDMLPVHDYSRMLMLYCLPQPFPAKAPSMLCPKCEAQIIN